MKHYYTLTFLAIVSLRCFAQDTDTTSAEIATRDIEQPPAKNRAEYKKNTIKMDVLSVLINNYSMFYERSVTRKIALQAGYRFQPTSNSWEYKYIKRGAREFATIDAGTNKDLYTLTTRNSAFTGEFRFYSGKKPGARGFYAGLYCRYLKFNFDYPSYTYTAMDASKYSIPLKGEVTGIGGGFVLGAKWWIAKKVSIDFCFLGGHYGKLVGNVLGRRDLTDFSSQEKARLGGAVENLFSTGKLGGINFVSTRVDNSGVHGNADGPFIGSRTASLAIGVVF